MRALLVFCHPLADSLNGHFRDVALAALEHAGHSVELLDLYAEDYRPALSAAERRAHYNDPASLRTAGTDQLTRAEILVFVFPIWWFSMPAMLKGWIDRTFAPGVAFANTPDFGPIQPLLTDLKRTFVITTLGAPWWLDLIVMRRPVQRVLKDAVIRACAPQSSFRYLAFHNAEKPDLARVTAFETRIRRALT